ALTPRAPPPAPPRPRPPRGGSTGAVPPDARVTTGPAQTPPPGATENPVRHLPQRLVGGARAATP
ncbi:hypothetical protein AB0K64_24790, partial [Streptomyces sp. NPDC053741]